MNARTAGLLSIVTIALAVTSAGADDRPELIVETRLLEVPADCAIFGRIPGEADSPVRWNYLLSFAACIQDASLTTFDDAASMHERVAMMNYALAPAMHLYLVALQEGPESIELRAAYQIGLASVGLLTRARASVRDAALRRQLEPLLARNVEIAVQAFGIVESIGSERPSRVRGPTERYMVRSARSLRGGLQPAVRIPLELMR